VRKTIIAQSIEGIGPKKIYVLDTNVLMHDPMSLFSFKEHDVYLPTTVFEELDNLKNNKEIGRIAREVTRIIDALLSNNPDIDIEDGIPLSEASNGQANGRLFFQNGDAVPDLPQDYLHTKSDNQILAFVTLLEDRFLYRPVVLVSKDIIVRIKARILGLHAQDYLSDQVAVHDSELLHTGIQVLTDDFWEVEGRDVEEPVFRDGSFWYYFNRLESESFYPNQFISFASCNKREGEVFARVTDVHGVKVVLRTITPYTSDKHSSVWGITARNPEQNFALNLLMDPEIDFVTLLGPPGTGKTLLALAAGLEQVMKSKQYSEIIMTRVTIPVGEDIGFLPGTEEEKMGPWMGALEDNLEVLNSNNNEAGNGNRAAIRDLIRNCIKIKSLNFMRGRTFLNKFLIIDEGQNLTPKQMKTLITRAGPGTKVIVLGNLGQIDTPWLTEASSGLAYVVERFKGWEHAGHITLERGERSRLATHAEDVL